MCGLITLGTLIVMLNSELPDTKVIQDIELKIPLRVYTSEGLLISEFGDERRNPVEIKDKRFDSGNSTKRHLKQL